MAQTSEHTQNIANAVQALRQAEEILTEQMNDTADPVAAIKINHAYQHLDSILSQTLQLQNVRDDATFAASAGAIKAQTLALQADQQMIKGLIGDMQTANTVIAHIGQALAFIGKLA